MFQRVAYENWHDIVPFIAFGVTAAFFLIMSIRGLRLRRDKADSMAQLPLED